MKRLSTLLLVTGLLFGTFGFNHNALAQSETVRFETSQTAITLINLVNKSTLSQELKAKFIAIIFDKFVVEVSENS